MLSHTHNQQYDNPFARNDDNDGFDFYQADSSTAIEPDVDLKGQSSTKQQQREPLINPFANLSGSIGSSVPSSSANTQQTVYEPAQYTGEDTLDEPVSVTIVSFLFLSWLGSEQQRHTNTLTLAS
jgi:hypothetical protein